MKHITLMAFANGQVSTEPADITRYIGLGVVNVVGINPNKAETEALFNRTLDEEPVYTGTQEVDGKQIRFARVDVVLRTVPEDNNGIENTSRMALFVREQFRYNRDQTKIQVIDKYGRTAWVTKAELEAHEIPTYSNGNKANLDKDYRPCYMGEEDLTNFFRTFLNIPAPMVYKNKTWVPADNLEDCQARFDNIANLFKGDFSELKMAWEFQKTNKVKVLFGIRTNQEGKQYQTFYTRMFLRNSQTSLDRLEEDVKQTQEAGGLTTSEFRVCPLQEYTVESTNLDNAPAATGDNPFGNPNDNPFFAGK